MSEIKHKYTKELVCPHCGYVFEDSWEFFTYENPEIDCYECDKTFIASRHETVTYSTQKIT
jgi:hypothetical protein